MLCGLKEVEAAASMCESCKDRLRREAMGEQAQDREKADRALTRHGAKPQGR